MFMIIIIGSYTGGALGVSRWDQMLAELMNGLNVQIGVCGNECYLKFNDYKEIHVLEEDESFVHESDPCLKYICTVRKLKE